MIRITNADDIRYKNGDIFEVKEALEGEVYTVETDEETGEEGFLVFDEEFEIHRKAGEEDAPNLLDTVYEACRAESDAVNHPNHYTQGRFETIEIIEEITQGYDDGFVAYNIGNVLKYIARAPHKHDTPLEDLRKAERYLRYAIERITQK
ncbi:DUF3310 domain-containing protein [Lysinibacillus sp. TE18511]